MEVDLIQTKFGLYLTLGLGCCCCLFGVLLSGLLFLVPTCHFFNPMRLCYSKRAGYV